MGKISNTKIPINTGAPGSQPVASTTTVYGRAFPLGDGASFCAAMAASGSATPDIDVYFEQTHLDPDRADQGNIAGTGQGAAGDIYNGWVQAVGASKVADITATTWFDFTISPVALPWGRFKFIGQGSNPANCVVDCNISQKES